jgi:serine-type D-Ala-D-Ala carboxypeptidase (penicillin-binding protein 5/6)
VTRPHRPAAPPVVLAIVLAAALTAVGASRPAAAHAQQAASAPPAIRAPAAILVEPATGDVVFGRRIAQHRPIASTTKLMTALLALERMRLGQRVTVVPYAATPAESTAGLRAGERLTAADLLRALLLASANEAAETLAVRIGGSERRFVVLMNRRARALGLTDTHYSTPVGLDRPGNRSSARDLVKLTLILRRNAFFRRVTDRPQATLRSGAQERTIVNRNTLVRTWAPADGVKTGHTLQAGYVLVGSATAHGVTVISAVLGEPSEAARNADSLALLRYGLARYRRVTALRRGAVLARPRVDGRGGEHGAVVASRTARRIVRRGEGVHTRVRGVPAALEGPLAQGTRVGTAEVLYRGQVVDRVPLVTARAVPAPSVVDRAGAALRVTLIALAVVAAALGTLWLAQARRRRRRNRGRRPHREGGVA